MTVVEKTAIMSLALLGLSCEPSPPKATDGELLFVNGTELFVKRIGLGEPVIVVHGGPVLEHGYLLPHLEPLADSYELIFFDQRLSGRSAGKVDSATVRLATFIDDIEGVRVALDLGEVHVLGHSWGGLLAMKYAIEYGDHLRSLVLLNSMSSDAALWRQEEAALSAFITEEDKAELQIIRESNAFGRMEPFAIASMLTASFKPQFYDRANVAALELYVPPDYADRSRQFGFMIEDLMNFDFTLDLRSVMVPTLIVYGAIEPAAKISGPVLDEALPNSEFVILENAGHFPFIEQPQATLGTIRTFLGDRPNNKNPG